MRVESSKSTAVDFEKTP